MAVSLSILERAIMAQYFFDYPTVIVTLQMALVLFLIETARILGIIKLQPYSFAVGKELLLPSLLTSTVAYISVNAAEQCWGVTTTMINPIKQFTPVFSMFLLNSTFRRTYPASLMQLLILALCVFSAVAVIIEFSFDFRGYFLALLTMVALASSNVLFENAGQRYSPVEMLYIHSFNCLVFLLFADLYEDEVRDSIIYLFTGVSTGFIWNAVFVLLYGAVLQFVLFYSLTYVGAVTTALTTCIAAVVEVMLAFVFSIYIYFDRMPSLMNTLAALLAVIAGIVFLHANPQLVVMTATMKKSQEIFSH